MISPAESNVFLKSIFGSSGNTTTVVVIQSGSPIVGAFFGGSFFFVWMYWFCEAPVGFTRSGLEVFGSICFFGRGIPISRKCGSWRPGPRSTTLWLCLMQRGEIHQGEFLSFCVVWVFFVGRTQCVSEDSFGSFDNTATTIWIHSGL